MGGKAGKLRVECEFLGVVNGVPVTVIGKGHVGDGRLDIELHADVVPLHWDPALVVFGSLDVILAVASLDGGTGAGDQSSADDGQPDPVFAHTDLVLLDDGHRELGRIETSFRAEVGPRCVRIRGQFHQARTNLEADERVTTVERVCVGSPVPLDRDGAAFTSTAAFETSFGHEILAAVVSRVVGAREGRDPTAGVDVCEVTVERGRGRERDGRVLVGVEYGESGSLARRMDQD